MSYSFADQAAAVDRAMPDRPSEDQFVLREAWSTLRNLHEGKFVSDGQFRTPNPVWDDMTKPCPRCGIRFEVIASGGGPG